MPVEIRVPQLGESVVEATVGRWLKQQGEQVAEGEPLVELETEKVNVQVSADTAGVLAKIASPEGTTVRVGDAIGEIEPGAAGAAPTAPARSAASAPAAPPTPAALPAAAPAEEEEAAPGVHPSTPSARRVAEEHGVDLQQVNGSGPGGRVTREDVLAFAERGSAAPVTVAQPLAEASTPPSSAAAPKAPAAPAAPGLMVTPQGRREERVRLSRRRLTIARRLVEAQQVAAMLTTFNEIDMSAVMELRKRRRDAFKERYGIGLGFMSFFTKASVGALKAFPRVNSELQGEELVLKYFYDVGVAVDTEGGLVVPVLRDADRKSFADIEREIADLATRARDNKLSLSDLQGGTFTITNGGIFGSLLSTPILNTPQVAILGMHRIQERAVVVNAEIVARPMMYVALTYDHRVIDGREAVQFLVRIKELLEDPGSLLLEG
ncbi:MAG: 2-oxoglutarate dehydrogenase complex dihydrolipoyllysine-residue succinyltransferase [Chloroflexota bacterium]